MERVTSSASSEALEHSFPILLQLMGSDEFAVLARNYIQRFPSVFRSVRYYGDQLAAFLSAEPRYAATPLLAEMARWEWAMANVFDAADATPIDIGALTDIKPESWAELRFEWSAALEVVSLRWNVAAIWKACRKERALQGMSLQGVRLRRQCLRRDFWSGPATGSCGVRNCKYTSGNFPQRKLRPSRRHARRESFGELCERLCGQLDEQAASLHAAAFLRGWVESGLIIAVQLPQQGV